jgi:hypothetical protein
VGEPRKVIRDYRFEPEKALETRKAVIAAQQKRHGDDPRVIVDGGRRVIPPYYPREPINAGDEMSPSGTKVEMSELADDVLAAISAGGGGSAVEVREADGTPSVNPTSTIIVPNDTLTPGGPGEAILDFNAFELREAVLGPFTALVAVGTAINVQTGVYAGVGSPVPVGGDTNVTLPASGAAFKDDGRIEVHLNGQELTKGDGSGNGEAEWVSSTQIKLNIKIKNKDQLLVRAPFPTM